MMTKPQFFTARLEEKIVHNPLYTELHFELISPPIIENNAGQFVTIDIPNPENGGPVLKRAYSMCDRPDINHGFELIIATTAPGIGSTYLTNLEFGAKINLVGPLGLFTVNPQPSTQNLTFVATGSGIAPIKAMITDLLQIKHYSGQIKLYWGMASELDFFWLDDLLDWQRNFPNFTFIPVVDHPSENWTLSRGLVTDCILVDGVAPNTEFYLCGNPNMVKDVNKLLQEHFSLDQNLIHREQF